MLTVWRFNISIVIVLYILHQCSCPHQSTNRGSSFELGRPLHHIIIMRPDLTPHCSRHQDLLWCTSPKQQHGSRAHRIALASTRRIHRMVASSLSCVTNCSQICRAHHPHPKGATFNCHRKIQKRFRRWLGSFVLCATAV